MGYISFENKYDKYPKIKTTGFDNEAWHGYEAIRQQLEKTLSELKQKKKIITVECYPAVRYDELLDGLIQPMHPDLVICSDDSAYSGAQITEMIKNNLTDDRVFGFMSDYSLSEFFNPKLVSQAKNAINNLKTGLAVVYGVGASLIAPGDILVYADLARWEIQKRYRSQETGNWKTDNFTEDVLRKFKRGYFVEWRAADKEKRKLFDEIGFMLDTNNKNDPKMASMAAVKAALKQALSGPFRLVPYFDPGVWGGQWMKEVCNLDKNEKNFAWSFDGVPEENSLYLSFGEVRLEIPAIDLVFMYPLELLGEKVYQRFGAEFPIRFDFLDTMGGENLSLQVHPLKEYIKEQFGMDYTQDESYYILEAKEGACVYLGVKTGIDEKQLIEDLVRAQEGTVPFPDEEYINRFPAKKHDHFLIPAGTVHCSGKDTMVLEISATPYIFTFKLWDWNRLGLDGLPRPVHIHRGKQVIQYERDTEWVKKNLINQFETIAEGDGWKEERTGLHELEFIETRRHTFSKPVFHQALGTVNVLNLVEGEEAIVESPENKFSPFTVHYAETFIIPATAGDYMIRPAGKSLGKTVMTIKAYVRD